MKKLVIVLLLLAGSAECGFAVSPAVSGVVRQDEKPSRKWWKRGTVKPQHPASEAPKPVAEEPVPAGTPLREAETPLAAVPCPPEEMIRFAPEVYDSLLACWYDRTILSATPVDQFHRDFVNLDNDSTTLFASNVPDSVYEARLRAILSPIQMPYNDIIKRYLIAYTNARKSTMERILERSQYYFPLFEEELIRAGMPLELRMLPVVESALNPVAISRVGATGLWQFMYSTGRMYGLEVTSFVDQRRDPVASTRAACRFLGDLYKMYGDWTLALAAYNCGPGNVNKAMRRAGEGAKTYWDIYPYLPRETRGYVPSFIAATYAYTYHRHHGIERGACPLPQATDTVMVNRLLHFDQVVSTIDVSADMLRALNPQYKTDVVPAVDGRSYPLILPANDILKYLDAEAEIHGKDSVYLAHYLHPANIDATKKELTAATRTYRVRSGDTLGGIARKHGVTVSQLVKWNGLKSANSLLRIGQRIEIR